MKFIVRNGIYQRSNLPRFHGNLYATDTYTDQKHNHIYNKVFGHNETKGKNYSDVETD